MTVQTQSDAVYLTQLATDIAHARDWCGSLSKLSDWSTTGVATLQRVEANIVAAYGGGALPPQYQTFVDSMNAVAAILAEPIIKAGGNFPRLWALELQAPTILSGVTMYGGIAQVDAWDVAAGGGIDQTHRNRTYDFVSAGVRDGYWPKMSRFCLHATYNVSHALCDLVGGNLYTAVNSPTFTADREIKGDGVAAYIESNFLPTGNGPYKLTSACIGVYSRTGPTVTTGCEIGAYAPYARLQVRGGGSLYAPQLNGQVAAVGNISSAPYTGTYHVNRTAADVITGWINGVKVVTPTQVGNRMPVTTFSVLGNKANGGAPQTWSAAGVSASWMGGGLLDAEIVAMHNNLRTYLTAVGAYP